MARRGCGRRSPSGSRCLTPIASWSAQRSSYARCLAWLGALIWLSVVSAGLVLAGLNWAALTENVVDRVLAPQNLLLLWFVYPLVKAVHELGHAYATKIYGGEVHEIGVMFLVFVPVPYVDATAASSFPNKRAAHGGRSDRNWR